ncbi:kinetochore protein NDC80 homolog [Latimeria chalumnae]|uniref:kinetochore protein NDC80 homolog n=1 Tax=Latimeria chalumnae TaxID=7897 RepID=UPI00313CCEF5
MSQHRNSSARVSQMLLRVTDNGKMTLTTPQSKDSSGLRKLSLARSMSGTSERKTSFFGKRTSGTGMTRTSQFGVFGGSEKIKDPRPLHDKAFVQQCIRQLCEALLEYGYPHNVTVKSLQAPSTKDFLKIFSFLYSLLEPNYILPDSKFEEEIPRIFKDLRYPFPLSKSSMYTVGAPHTWPQIVGALMWLITCIKVTYQHNDNVSASNELDMEVESKDGVQYNRLFLSYTAKCYNHFMQGADTFEEEDAEFLPKLKQLYNVDEAQLEALAVEHKDLLQEVEKLENEPDRLLAMRKLKASLQSDLQRYQTYLEEVESHKAILKQKLNVDKEENEGAVLELNAVNQEKARLQSIFDNQTFTVADIERINLERNELQQSINKLSKSLQEAEHNAWEEEIDFAKARESFEAELAEYHKIGRKVKIIPPTAEFANGQDFEIKLNLESGLAGETQLSTQLLMLSSQVDEEVSKGSSNRLAQLDMLEQLKICRADKADDVKVLKENARKLDEQYGRCLQEAEQEEHKWSSKTESQESYKNSLEKGMYEDIEKAKEELKAAERELQLIMQETSETNKKVVNNLSRILEVIITHIDIVEKHFEKRYEKVEEDYKEFVKEPLLAAMTELVKKYHELVESCEDQDDAEIPISHSN